MNSHLRPFIAMATLAVALSSTNADAGLVVTGTTGFGEAGNPAVPNPTMQVTAGDSGVDFSAVVLWDFRLDWDETALTFDPNASTISFGSYSDSLANFVSYMYGYGFGTVYDENLATTVGDGYFVFGWDGFFGTPGTVDLGSALNFSGAFSILPGTPTGDYAIRFDPNGPTSVLASDFGFGDYGAATPPMQVTVTAPAAIPEPGSLGLLLGGLGAFLGLAALRRKTTD
ncbi:MAG: PEP-CTERM sorting domain-containing protein [Pseudomonadota bacterium]|nr:PEP-CTERM sorting domain-containing protein [Pseudomonadota bacterium]